MHFFFLESQGFYIQNFQFYEGLARIEDAVNDQNISFIETILLNIGQNKVYFVNKRFKNFFKIKQYKQT